jgi:hypothetical protein
MIGGVGTQGKIQAQLRAGQNGRASESRPDGPAGAPGADRVDPFKARPEVEASAPPASKDGAASASKDGAASASQDGAASASQDGAASASRGRSNPASAPPSGAASVPVTLLAEEPEAPPPPPSGPQQGLRCGTFLRPDPFLSDRTQVVVHAARTPNNPHGVAEVEAGRRKQIALDQLLSGQNEVLIGFGSPRVSTVVPNGAGTGYQKLDAVPYFRRKTSIGDAAMVESGVFIRPRDLPADAADALRSAMNSLAGHRTESSAHANGQLLAQAGFTSGGKSLGHAIFPYRLFKRIVDKGLEYKGQPIEFDIISTTPATLDEHFRRVIHEEVKSPLSSTAQGPNGTAPAAPVSPTAPAPVPPGVTVHIRNSRPGAAASLIRGMIGAHVMWEALGDPARADVDKFLPTTLKDKFHDDKPLTRGEKLKKMLFTPAKVKFLRKCLGKTFDDGGDFAPSQIADMVRVPGPGEEIKPDKDGLIKYNIVICGSKSQRGNRVVIARLDVKGTKADDILSKHVLISGYDQDVRFAGEMWAERYVKPDGTEATRIHVNNNSGTYRPKPEMAKAAAEYLTQMFPGVEFVSHATGAPAPKGKPDYIKGYPVPDAKVASLASLDGQKVTLTDADGHGRKYAIHRFMSVGFDMEFLDTPNRDLLARGGLLRARTRFKSSGEVKNVDVEAKLPAAGSAYANRVKGGSFKSAEEWQTARAGLLASGSSDKAVELARTQAGPSLPLDTVVWKKTQRELYFVTPTFPPLLGRLDPSFLVSVDTNTVRDSADGAPKATYTVLQPQIFTKLPWTKKITPQRVQRFEDLSRQLSSRLGLTEATQTPYAEAVDHLEP